MFSSDINTSIQHICRVAEVLAKSEFKDTQLEAIELLKEALQFLKNQK